MCPPVILTVKTGRSGIHGQPWLYIASSRPALTMWDPVSGNQLDDLSSHLSKKDILKGRTVPQHKVPYVIQRFENLKVTLIGKDDQWHYQKCFCLGFVERCGYVLPRK